MNAQFIAWLVGVDVSDVVAYRDVADWPTHWAAKAQHHLRALGIGSEREALSVFRSRYYYG